MTSGAPNRSQSHVYLGRGCCETNGDGVTVAPTLAGESDREPHADATDARATSAQAAAT